MTVTDSLKKVKTLLKKSIEVEFGFPAENVTVIQEVKCKHNIRDISVYQIGLFFVNFPGGGGSFANKFFFAVFLLLIV